MYNDVILGQKTKEFENIAREMGFQKIINIKELKLKIIQEENYEKLRSVVSSNKIDILLNPHIQTKKDNPHFRMSGLDHVLCKELHNKNIKVAITLDTLTNYTEIGRAMQNIRLCRKYKVKILFFTFAKTPYELRSVKDLQSFLKILGMTGEEVGEATKL